MYIFPRNININTYVYCLFFNFFAFLHTHKKNLVQERHSGLLKYFLLLSIFYFFYILRVCFLFFYLKQNVVQLHFLQYQIFQLTMNWFCERISHKPSDSLDCYSLIFISTTATSPCLDVKVVHIYLL